MGADIEEECQECCRFNSNLESEIIKNNSKIDKNVKNGGEIINNNPYMELTFINNNSSNAVLILINPKIYYNMNSGETLHQILEPLIPFNNNILFEIMIKLFDYINKFKNNFNFRKNEVFDLYNKIYHEILDNKIIDNMIKSELGYFTKIKFNLLEIIEIETELYHFLSFSQRILNEPYNINYWDFIKNPNIYMKKKLIVMKQIIENINSFVTENKLKNLNHSLDIHITSNSFNIQIEQ